MQRENEQIARSRSRWREALFLFWAVTWPVRSLGQEPPPLNPGTGQEPKLEATEAARRVKDAMLAVKARLFSSDGRANYTAMKTAPEWRHFRQQAAALRTIDLGGLTTPEAQKAFWINIYNALVTDGILSLDVRGSVLKTADFFRRVRYQIGGYPFSLDDIEHGVLRGNRPTLGRRVFKPGDPRLAVILRSPDPRIHFALNCGALSCPPIGVYDAESVDSQLDVAARNFINGPDVQIDANHNTIRISRIFQWYAGDFGDDPRDTLRFIARCLKEGPSKYYLEKHLAQVAVRYLPYDWSLNGFDPSSGNG